jgi:hypothetical protein
MSLNLETRSYEEAGIQVGFVESDYQLLQMIGTKESDYQLLQVIGIKSRFEDIGATHRSLFLALAAFIFGPYIQGLSLAKPSSSFLFPHPPSLLFLRVFLLSRKGFRVQGPGYKFYYYYNSDLKVFSSLV